ncbi:MAG TPA: 16S rRNA (cytosine(1402)-N(4))-methyltransferase, partial [Chitinophagaceae bacterium]|nr:16S rRNA (cytosine(1402)-N(4))-methyltransferase [Chitinophagaceae bacterium]
MNASYQHMSVLPEETLRALELRKDGLYVDATMGGAGHTKMILQKLGSEARMVLFDQDEAAWGNAPKD